MTIPAIRARILFPLLLSLALCAGKAPAAAPEAPDEFFPIVAWGGPFGDDPDFFREMKECGITIAGFSYPYQLDMIAEAGLKTYVYDPACFDYDWSNPDPALMRERFSELAGRVGGHPAVYGYFVKDEPGAGLFPGLAAMVEIIAGEAPGQQPYINLFPSYAGASLGTGSFREYVSRYLDECRPPVIGYDFYGLLENDSKLRAGFWSDLRTVREESLARGVPFWFCALSIGQQGCQAPTEAGLSFQAYSAIAHGAKGICWFTYHGIQMNGWHGAPLDQFGARTPAWRAMRYVNLTLLNYAPLINHLRSDAVYHIKGFEDDINPPPENSLITHIPWENFLVGDFTHDETGDRYVLLVNKYLNRSNYAEIHWRTPPKAVYMQAPWGRYEVPWGGEHMMLAPGGAVFLRVEY